MWFCISKRIGARNPSKSRKSPHLQPDGRADPGLGCSESFDFAQADITTAQNSVTNIMRCGTVPRERT